MTIGTLTRNTDPNQKWPSRKPLARGPRDPAAPVTPAQMAMAFVRSSGGKMFTMIDRVDGMMNAAAAPMIARQAMISHVEVAMEARPHPTRNSARPNWSAPLRP